MAKGEGKSRKEPMSRVDTAWLRMERPTNLMMITSVMMFDEQGKISWPRVSTRCGCSSCLASLR